MPKENIERVLKKAEGGEGEQEEIRYEGYGAGGTAFIVEAMTDNRNRTASEVRAAFSKFPGQPWRDGQSALCLTRLVRLFLPALWRYRSHV